MPTAVASALAAARSAQNTLVPSAADASAEDLPMPEAAPSTTAAFPGEIEQLAIIRHVKASPAQPRISVLAPFGRFIY
jgi:hypothetical protein